MATKNSPKQCYNSFSCVLSVLIIVFVLSSILWDMTVTKPAMRESIEQIQTEVQVIHSKIDAISVPQPPQELRIEDKDTLTVEQFVDKIFSEITLN